MPTRAEALALLSEWNVNPSLRKHGLLVEAGVNGYAVDDGQDNATVETWGIAGLLHDLDYERFPDPATPGAIGAALILLVSPLLWRLALERDAERTARIRTEERADVAARVHDSVLQTLALIQRHAEEPHRVASLARRQERELRSWLYGVGTTAPDGTLSSALGAAASEVEELHGVRVELFRHCHGHLAMVAR